MFTLESATNLEWTNPEHTAFNCVVKFAEFNESMPFHCTQEDAYLHSQELFQRGLTGEFGEIAEYVDSSEPAQDQPVSDGAQTL